MSEVEDARSEAAIITGEVCSIQIHAQATRFDIDLDYVVLIPEMAERRTDAARDSLCCITGGGSDAHGEE